MAKGDLAESIYASRMKIVDSADGQLTPMDMNWIQVYSILSLYYSQFGRGFSLIYRLKDLMIEDLFKDQPLE